MRFLLTYDEFVTLKNRTRFVSPGVFTMEHDISVIESDFGQGMADMIDKVIVSRLIDLASE